MLNKNKTALPEYEEDVLVDEEILRNLILYNDDVNSFEWVIETLIEVCRHEPHQAEQCAYIVHFKGKCSVKSALYDELESICIELLNRGLSAKID